jgi:uncharacterized membrane protein
MRTAARYSFAVFFIVAGIAHFIIPELYKRIIPPYLPAHDAINAISGAVEIIIGALIALPKTQRLGGYLAIALLIAVFPANIYLSPHQELMPQVPPLGHLLRLPLQLVFIAWAYVAGDLGNRGASANRR